jgi:hypothetical protein
VSEKRSFFQELKRRARRFVYSTAEEVLQLVFGETRRPWTVGFGPSVIPPKTTVTVQAQPQCRFRGRKIINTGDKESLYIQGLYVGQKSQLPTYSNPISMRVFDGLVLDNELRMDDCDPALYITWQIQNTSDEEKTWSASILGDISIDPSLKDNI